MLAAELPVIACEGMNHEPVTGGLIQENRQTAVPCRVSGTGRKDLFAISFSAERAGDSPRVEAVHGVSPRSRVERPQARRVRGAWNCA